MIEIELETKKTPRGGPFYYSDEFGLIRQVSQLNIVKYHDISLEHIY